MKVSIIIPVYNEEKTIKPVLDKVLSVKLPECITREVVVIDDGSLDQTAQVLGSFYVYQDVKIFHQANQGKTAAVVSGIARASGDIILIQDADLEYDPVHFPALVEPFLRGGVDVIYGSRFLGEIKDMSLINYWANWVTNWTLRMLYRVKITDVNTCYKAFKLEVIREIPISSQNFGFETEATVKLLKKGVRIIEVPINYVARTRQEGKKINWVTALEMFWQIIKYRFYSP